MKPQKNLIASGTVRELLGNISEATLYRYRRSNTMGFPKPFTLNRRHFWDADEIKAFVESLREAEPATT